MSFHRTFRFEFFFSVSCTELFLLVINAGTSKDKQPAHDDTENEGHKRKRASTDEGEPNIEGQLIDVLERNSRMLSAQLDAQNLNSQLDREQRKDQTNSLLVILNKLADALGKIADKL